MRKLRLRPEELRVESFSTVVPKVNERGTVRANDSVDPVPISAYCNDSVAPSSCVWTDPTAGWTWQPDFTCPECAPMETRDGPC